MANRSDSIIDKSKSNNVNAHINRIKDLITRETEKPGSIVDAFGIATTALLDEMAKLPPHDRILESCRQTFELLNRTADDNTEHDFQRQAAMKISLIIEETLTKVRIINHRVTQDEEKADVCDAATDCQIDNPVASAIRQAEIKIKYLIEMLNLTLSDLFFSTAKEFCVTFASAVYKLLYFCVDAGYSSDLFKVTYVRNQEPGLGNDLHIETDGIITDSCLSRFKPLIAHKENFIAFLSAREEEFLADISNQQQPDTTRQFVRNFLKDPHSPFFVIVSGARDRNDNNKPTGAVSQTMTRDNCIRSYHAAPDSSARSPLISSLPGGASIFSALRLGR